MRTNCSSARAELLRGQFFQPPSERFLKDYFSDAQRYSGAGVPRENMPAQNFVIHPQSHQPYFTDEGAAILRDIQWGFDIPQTRFISLLCHFSVYFLRRVPLQVSFPPHSLKYSK